MRKLSIYAKACLSTFGILLVGYTGAMAQVDNFTVHIDSVYESATGPNIAGSPDTVFIQLSISSTAPAPPDPNSLRLANWQFGLNVTNFGAVFPVGSVRDFSFVENSNSLSGGGLSGTPSFPPTAAQGYNTITNQMRATAATVNISAATSPIVTGGPANKINIGTYRLTSSLGFIVNAPLQLSWYTGGSNANNTSSRVNFYLGFNTSPSNAGWLPANWQTPPTITLNPTTPLPVQWLSFEGRNIGTADELTWSTSVEENNSGFNVLYSTDGIQYTTIGHVESKSVNGNSNLPLSYSFIHTSPVQGHNYYRLQQVDIDGKSTLHSKVIDLIHQSDVISVNLYPNPAADVLHADIFTERDARMTLKINDLSGRTVKVVQFDQTAGTQTLDVDVKGFAAGVYNVQVLNRDEVIFNGKINKQ
ncbi:MAG: T9SS type A sorting domain-containing protein [Chitinophagaceae bacterium]|nr:T9SS type A sorting domain-containing protein [Chitinophagaceae bacterium]